MSTIVTNSGITGNGKTRRCLWLQEDYSDKEPFVIDPFGQFRAHSQFTQISPKEDMAAALPQIKNAIIFIDEAQLITSRYDPMEFLEVLGQCRHNYTMTVLCYSALQLIPSYIRLYANMHIIGHTNDKIEIAKEFGGALEPKIRKAMQSLSLSRPDPTDPKDERRFCAEIVENM